MSKQFSIEVKDSLIDPMGSGSQKALYKQRDKRKRPLYKVWLYLDGPDLPYVRSVTYELHPTFPNPVVTIDRTNTNPICRMGFWTWGIFTVQATIITKTGETISLSHGLTYGSEIEQQRVHLVKS